VVVDVDPGAFPDEDLEALGWQRPQGRRIKLLEGAAPVGRQFLEGALVQIDQQQGNGLVELNEAGDTKSVSPLPTGPANERCIRRAADI